MIAALLLTVGLFACVGRASDDSGGGASATDGGVADGGVADGGSPDGGSPDGGSPDGGSLDGGSPDGGSPDGGSDTVLLSADAIATAGPLDGMLFGTIQDVLDVNSGEVVDSQSPAYLALGFSPAATVPWLSVDGGEGCWLYSMDLGKLGNALPDPFVVDVGGASIEMDRVGRGVYVADIYSDDPEAAAAATVGAELSIGGVTTGIAVPEALVLTDVSTAWTELRSTGTMPLRWTPPGTARDRGFVQVVLTSYDSGHEDVACVLTDDGVADIELGYVPDSFDLMISRVESVVVDSSDGTIGAFLTRDLLLTK